MDSESSQTPSWIFFYIFVLLHVSSLHFGVCQSGKGKKKGPTMGLWWFWIYCKHLFCSKNILLAKNSPYETVKSDDSSLNHCGKWWLITFHSFVGAVYTPKNVLGAKQMLAMDSESSQIPSWNFFLPLHVTWSTCILMYFTQTVKSMGPKLSSVITVIKLPDWQGYRTKM